VRTLISLAAATVLGACAAAINYACLHVPKVRVVGIKSGAKLEFEKAISLESLTEISLPVLPNAGLTEDFYKGIYIDWEDRFLLEGLRSNRDVSVGVSHPQPFLLSDLRSMIELKKGEYDLLRFRVLAAGDKIRTAKSLETASESSLGSASPHVTIAVRDPSVKQSDEKIDRASQRIIRYVIDQDAKKSREPILGVSVFPNRQDQQQSGDIFTPKPGEMALTVPLQGIASVPGLILVGGEIGFFMPREAWK
jgi:hypothetical protein